jgi:hypothetical protein
VVKLTIALADSQTDRVIWLEQWPCPEPPADPEDEQLTDWVYAQVHARLRGEQ